MNYKQLQDLYKSKGYKFFTDIYALNIFGFANNKVDEFSDVIGVAFVDGNGNESFITFKGTTRPGLYYLKSKLLNSDGTFILKEGQYLSCWALGKHQGKYEALRQNGSPFDGYRDNNSDGKLDLEGKIYRDVSGLNLHTTSFNNDIDKVGAYSAGCQVIQDDKDFLILMAIIKKAVDYWKSDKFSYTLFQN